MKYQANYTFSFLTRLPSWVQIPLQIELENKKLVINEVDECMLSATGFIEISVDPKELTLSIEDINITPRSIIIPKSKSLHHFLSKAIWALSFIIDIPIRYASSLSHDRLVPESTEDQSYLELLGTHEIHHDLSISMKIRTFVASDFVDDFMDKLFKKETGLALYAQALLQQEPTGKFRELWKVLEAAFGLQNEKLIRCLSNFNPTKQLGFSDAELRSFLILRGSVSHAASRAGMEELNRVTRQVEKKLPRLNCLVEQVLLTKKVWGERSIGYERLAPLSAYINVDNALVIFKRK